jgi:phage tail protein X
MSDVEHNQVVILTSQRDERAQLLGALAAASRVFVAAAMVELPDFVGDEVIAANGRLMDSVYAAEHRLAAIGPAHRAPVG